MYPSGFDYQAPATLDAALALLTEHGEDAKVLAGGQSLIPLMKLRFADPTVVIDLNGIPGLGEVNQAKGVLRIGAMTRHSAIAGDASLASKYPTLTEAAPQIADPLIRNLGTVGGSLAHADPSGDWGSVMLALDAEVVATGPKGERTIAIRDLLDGPFSTSLAPDEILTEIRVPTPTGAVGGAYMKMERKVGDFATVGVAVSLQMKNGTIGRAGLGLTAVGSRNLDVPAAIELLTGAEPTQDVFDAAADAAAEVADPNSDVRGSADYKRAIVREYVRRGLAQALQKARATV